VRTRKAGQALVEYVVLLALASVIGVVVVGVAGQQLTDAFDRVTAAVANPMDLLATPTPTPTASLAPPPPADSPAAPTGTEPPVSPTSPAQPVTTSSPAAEPAPTPAPAPTPNPDVEHHGHHDG